MLLLAEAEASLAEDLAAEQDNRTEKDVLDSFFAKFITDTGYFPLITMEKQMHTSL